MVNGGSRHSVGRRHGSHVDAAAGDAFSRASQQALMNLMEFVRRRIQLAVMWFFRRFMI